MNIQNLNESNLDEVLSQYSLVVLDFWAEWCAPCKSFAKTIEHVAKDYPEVLFGKIDIEAEPKLAEEFQIRSIPAVMILKDQTVVYADSGALNVSSLVELLEKAKALKLEDIQ